MKREVAMGSMYAMRRANGDWFAFAEGGHLRLPVFSSSHAAMQARARNWGMLLFKPAIFDEHALNDVAPTGGETSVHFWLADGASTKLSHGHLIDHARLVLLIHDPAGQSPQ
jgi:hypothetical protein